MALFARTEPTEHPSNYLSRGEARDFPDALGALRAAVNYELAHAEGWDADDRESYEALYRLIAEVDGLYRAAIAGAEEVLAAHLIDLADQRGGEAAADLRLMAEALTTADYSRLAI